MNYLEQWTFFPDLAAQEKQIEFYRYALLDPMTEGTVGAGLTTVCYKKEAMNALKDNLLFGTGVYKYNYEFRNSLAKPSLPYYPLSV